VFILRFQYHAGILSRWTYCSGIAKPRTLDTRKGRAKRTFRKANMVSIDFVYVYWEVVGRNG
jgi:hypothetical protein